MEEAVIHVEGLGKQYRIGTRESYRTIRDHLTRVALARVRVLASWTRADEGSRAAPPAVTEANRIWALREVSFSIRRGEAVGIIGANGAGKSTLLKILSRITEPTEGFADVEGRVGSLLEVGTGFHPELTGRENVYLNGAILGMRRAEIRSKLEEILGFAGVEKFADTPVKRYSSGMYLRLAFSVAAHLETEILLVDEVLAVGDAAFQLKCLNKMSEVAEQGRTILFVSHNLEAVAKLCGRGILLSEGRTARIGTPQDCIEQYLSAVKQQRNLTERGLSLRSHPGRSKPHQGPVRLTGIQILDGEDRPTTSVGSGEPLGVALEYELVEAGTSHDVMFAVTFSNFHNHRLASCRSHDTYLEPIRVSGSGRVICRVRRLPLVPGLYRLSVGCNTEAGHSDGVYDALTLDVAGGKFYPSGLVPARTQGEILLDHDWEVQGGGPSDAGAPNEPQAMKA